MLISKSNLRLVVLIQGIGITLGISVVALLLALFSGNYSSHAGTRPNPTKEILGDILVAHFQAIERNSNDGASSYFHSQSPERLDMIEEIELITSGYLQTIGRFEFSSVELQDKFAVMHVIHDFTIITGVKYIPRTVESTYRFKEEKGLWRIWSKQNM